MQPAQRTPNWIVASISLGAFAAILIILFSVMTGPFNTVMDQIGDSAEKLDVEDEVDPFLSLYLTVFGLIFILSMIGLIAWYVLGSHREEYDEQVYRRGP